MDVVSSVNEIHEVST